MEVTDTSTPRQREPRLSAQCPACGLNELVPIHLTYAGYGRWQMGARAAPNDAIVEIDACPACYGAWFDAGELDLLAGEHAGIERFLDPESVETDRCCPRGHGQMQQHQLPAIVSTPVDRCHFCAGVWLDGDERRKLAKSSTKEGQQTIRQRWVERGAIWVAQLLTQMPVEFENPVRSTPWVVFGIIALLLIVFSLQLIGIIDTYQVGLVSARLLREHTLANLFNHIWLHGSWLHLLANVYFLYTFGDNIEHIFGRFRFALFFVVAGIFGGIGHIWFSEATAVPVVGASGAIAGVLAAYLWTFPRTRLLHVLLYVQLKLPVWVYLLFWVLFHLFMALLTTNEQVAWFAHLGGFLFGLAATPWLLEVRRRQVAQEVRVPAYLKPAP